MRKLLRPVFTSCLGALAAFFVVCVFSYALVSFLIGQSGKPPKVRPDTVLRISLNQEVPERTNNVEINPFDWQNRNVLGLRDLLYVIRKARTDDKIKGIFLDADAIPLGLAGARSLRRELIDFRESGKFVYAHSNYYSQGAYYLATAADSVFLNPSGMIDLRGFAAQIPFYKNMLAKAGVQMEVFFAGKFKSASEPYRREYMSDESRLQVRTYVDEIFGRFLSDISESRNIPVPKLQEIVDNWDGSSDALSLSSGLIDRVGYQDEVVDAMRRELGLGPKAKIKTIRPEKYFRAHPREQDRKVKDKIAILYAEGGFIGGEETPGAVTEKHYVKMIRELRRDEHLKAIVLRINSGGGNALVSENIWRELKLAGSEEKIPLVVSMGDVAASAGFMIAAPADSIFAEEWTLTGSIGVYGMMPTVQKLMNERLGINFDTVTTGQMAAGFTPFFSFSEQERKLMQVRVEENYTSFLQKVAEGRKKTEQEIHEIAQGRVWTGPKAVEIGLVDRINTLEGAILSAADLAGIEAYRISEYPKTKNPFQQLLGEIMDPKQAKMRRQQAFLRGQLGPWYPYYAFLQEVSTQQGPQARLPFFIPFN